MKLSDAKDFAILAALAGGAYFVYKLLNKVPDALNAAGSAIGTGAADFKDFVSEKLFGPQYSMVFYAVHFANNETHAIPVKSQEFPDGIDSRGLFTFRGKQFRIRDRVNAAGKTEHWAFLP